MAVAMETFKSYVIFSLIHLKVYEISRDDMIRLKEDLDASSTVLLLANPRWNTNRIYEVVSHASWICSTRRSEAFSLLLCLVIVRR